MAPLTGSSSPADLHQLVIEVAAEVRNSPGTALPTSALLDPRRHHDTRTAQLVDICINRCAPLLDHRSRQTVHQLVMAQLSGLGVLATYLQDPDVTEVAVNSGSEVWVDRLGTMRRVDSIEPDELHAVVERVLAPLGLRFDRTSPVVDARLPGGQRLCAVLEPLAVDGTCVSIRRFALQHVTIEAFAGAEVCALLRQLVMDRANIVVSGATSSGKTTLLNALGALLPAHERIITIEDAAELRLGAAHVVRLEARPATPDGVPAVTVRDLLHAALRLRPDRLVIGEVRGAEAYDMVQALNTGHDGSLSTVHANSPHDALRRIVSLAALAAPNQAAEMLEQQVRASIDVIIHVERAGSGRRVIARIDEVSTTTASCPPTSLLASGNNVVGLPQRTRGQGYTP